MTEAVAINAAIFKANGTAAVKDTNFALLASRPIRESENMGKTTSSMSRSQETWQTLSFLFRVSGFPSTQYTSSFPNFQLPAEVYPTWESLAAFAAGCYHLEVASTAAPFANGMPVPIAFNDPRAHGVSSICQIVPFAKSQWSRLSNLFVGANKWIKMPPGGVTTKEVTTPMAGLATTIADPGGILEDLHEVVGHVTIVKNP